MKLAQYSAIFMLYCFWEVSYKDVMVTMWQPKSTGSLVLEDSFEFRDASGCPWCILLLHNEWAICIHT